MDCTAKRVKWEREWVGKESEGGERPGEVEEGELEIIVGGELRTRWKVMGEKQRVESGGYFSLCPGDFGDLLVKDGEEVCLVR